MNVLVVADKADVKLYETVIKSAPNTSVLGAVTKINSGFSSVIPDKYNPHAIVFDTDVPVKNAEIKGVIESISKEFPYIKILILTSEEDETDYPAYETIRGQISNLEIREIIKEMSENDEPIRSGSSLSSEAGDRSDKEKRSDNLISAIDKPERRFIPKPVKAKRRRLSFRFNPLILAGAGVAALIVFVVVAVIIKSNSAQDLNNEPEIQQTETTEASYVSEPTAQPTSLWEEYPTTVETLHQSVISEPTIAPQTTAPKPTEKKATETSPPKAESDTVTSANSSSGSASGNTNQTADNKANQQKKKSESSSPASGGGSSGSSGSSSGSSGGASQSSSQGQVTETRVYPGDTVVSYDEHDRYENSGGNAVSSVKINYSSKTLQVDETIQLTAAVSPSNANQSVSWSSSDTSVATVTNGLVTAKKAGSATIKATANNGKSAGCQIIVKEKAQTDNVHLSAKEYHLKVGQNIAVTLYGTSNCSWSVSNEAVVRLYPSKNQNQVQAVARRTGKAIITAKNKKTNKTYTCQIYVD